MARAVWLRARIRGFSRLVRQTSPSGRGGRSPIGMRTTSLRSKMGTAELVGWTMRPWATSERISLMVCTGWMRRIGRPVAQDVDVAAAQRPVRVEGLDFLEPGLAAWVAGVERCDEPAERRAFGGEHEADAQQPADGAGQLA